MKKKLICVFLTAALLFSCAVSVSARDFGCDVTLTCNAVYLKNLDTGEVILSKNADVQVHPASTTKIMSAALALSLCDDPENTMVTIADDIWAEFDGLNVSSAGLKGGEVVSLYDLVCCMMLQSANEGASAVAEYFGWDYFIDLMNEKAVELGCTGTHFTGPHGVFVADHYTTAQDMAKITEWALTVPGFYEISQMATYTKAETNLNEEVTLVTTNLMQLPSSVYYTSYIKGIKTGTLDEAGRCLVSTAQKNGTTYLLVLLGGPFESDTRVWSAGGSSVFTETRLIYDWAFENLALESVTDTDEVVAEIGLRHASKKDSLLLYPADDLFTLVNANREDEPAVTFEIQAPETVEAPVAIGQEIGTAQVYLDGDYVGEVALISREEIPLDRFVLLMDGIQTVLTSTAAKIVYVLLLFIIAFYLFYMLVVVPRAQKKRRKKRR